jgi:hypothetical protein
MANFETAAAVWSTPVPAAAFDPHISELIEVGHEA